MVGVDVEAVRRRWVELAEPGAVDALRAERVAAVLSERWVAHDDETYLPQPVWQERMSGPPRAGLTGRPGNGRRLGLDASGRAITVEVLTDDYLVEEGFLAWGDDVVEQVILGQEIPLLVRTTTLASGRIAACVEVSGMRRLDGEPAVEITRFDYDAVGAPVREVRVYESGDHPSWKRELGPYWGSTATRLSRDADGSLTLVEHVVVEPRLAFGADHVAALQEADAAIAADQVSASVTWDGRIAAPVADLPAPERAADGLAEPLATHIHDVAAAAREALGTLAFLVVDLWFIRGSGPPQLLNAVIADAGFRDRANALVDGASELLDLAQQGDGPGNLDLISTAPPGLSRHLRTVQQAWETTDEETQTLLRHQLAVELARALDRRRWDGAEETFLPVVRSAGIPQERHSNQHLPATREALGAARVDAFLASLKPRSPSARQAATETDLASRDALAEFLQASGLRPHEAAAVAGGSQWAILFEDDEHGSSVIGGRPVLPAEVPWPTNGGRPLTHLATVLLDDLPSVEGRDRLPPTGHLSFFADLSEEAELYEPIEAGDPGRERVAIFHAPGGSNTHTPDPPEYAPGLFDVPIAMDERRVRPVARLQTDELGLPWTAGRYGLDGVSAQIMRQLADAINGDGAAQMLGYPPVVQEDPREDDEVAVFHMGPDAHPQFEFLDDGDLFFYGPPDDVGARRWDHLTVWPSSC
jgi:hypothetical protein